MKLRLQPDKCIVRLSDSDLDLLRQGATAVKEIISFRPGMDFVYRLESSELETQISAVCGASSIYILAPKSMMDEWLDNRQTELTITGETGVNIVLQKDLHG